MPTAHSKEVVTSALLVIGGKILSGRTKNQNIDYSYPFFDSQHGPNTNVVLRARDAQKLPIACRIGLADLAELHPDVAFARIRAHRFREHANADLPRTWECASCAGGPRSSRLRSSSSIRAVASARGSLSIGTPNAFATQSAVMSPWVGPIPPVVKT
jgi:hypothetical protein